MSLEKEFVGVCKGFVDNKLSIDFAENITKSFFSVRKKTCWSLTFDNNRIKQFDIVEYLGYYRDTNLSGESMTIKSLKNINAKLQFFYRKK